MKSNHLGKLVAAMLTLVAALALTAPLAPAATPAPGYSQFAGCPSPDEDPAIKGCVTSVVTGGHFQMGNKDVPITKPITVSGGVEDGLVGFSYNSKGGMTPVKQQIPGGVIGLTGLDWLVNFLGVEQLKLYAVTELAGEPILDLTEITMPIKVHLINQVLGSKCYVGSNATPIVLEMTTLTTSPPPPNEPISGSGPKGGFKPGEILTLEGTYVDNAFAAPGANGCTLTLFGFIPVSLNGLVNVASGLPAAAGTNETVQSVFTEIAPSPKVYP